MSDSSGNWFSRFKKVSPPGPKPNLGVAPKPTPEQSFQPGAAYKKGDLIGQKYEVYGVLGTGGCGVVYLVYSHELGEVYAMKTFRDEFLADQEVRKRFQKEASVWVELGRYHYLVRAIGVVEVSGRLYILMEHIAPNEEGLNSLEGYLQRQPPDLAQSLRWAIQICHGMEYAYSKGVRAHRDLKPANIMIAHDMTAKITDFGLAGVLSESPAARAVGLSAQPGRPGLSGQTMLGTGFGTPAYMAPEQFDNAAVCDERSDIYSFGVVLYQMAVGGRLPFLAPAGADVWQAMRQLHRESAVPRLDSPLFPIIQRCLEKSPGNRYQTFKELRKGLEPLLQHQTGEVVIPQQLTELQVWEWTNKGTSLDTLGRHEEAIRCFDKALELDPRFVGAWSNKGNSLTDLGRNEEAILCCDKALELDPRNVDAWNNKGNSLNSLERFEEAIRCFDKAMELGPRNAVIWSNKGGSLHSLGRHGEAILCIDTAMELDQRNAVIWSNKGGSLDSLGRHEEAIFCCDKALELDPRNVDAWTNKGASLGSLERFEEAILCLDTALELDPRNAVIWSNKGKTLGSLERFEEAIRCFHKALEFNPRYADAWYNKGVCLGSLGRHEEAIHCYDKSLEPDSRNAASWINKALAEDILGQRQKATVSYQQFLKLAPVQYAKQIEYASKRLLELGGKNPNPSDAPQPTLELDPHDVVAWTNKGNSLTSLGRHEEALDFFDKALALDPHNAVAWYNKGVCLGSLGRHEEAIHCYDKVLELDPRDAHTWTNKGNSLYSLGRYEDAVHCYNKALEFDPHDVVALTNKGNSLTSLGRHEEALGFFNKALALDAHNVNAWTNKGASLLSLGRFEEALSCYDKALELDPRDVDAWVGKAMAEDALSKWREAAHSYQQFLALDPSQQYAKQIEYARKRLPELGK